MQISGISKTFFKLHLSIIIAGLTGIFGKLISLNEGLLVWYRVLLTSIFFFVFLLISKKSQKITIPNFFRIAKVGGILTLHWLFFYGSIKASNVSIGVVCISAMSFFTAILEPLIFHRKFSLRELIYSIITLLGVTLIFSFDDRYRLGITLGIISAALASLFTIRTKQISNDFPAKTILLYQMIGGVILLSAILPFYLQLNPVTSIIPSTKDFIWILMFVIVCTIGLQLLQISVLKKISAFTVNLSYNLEPVYSVILAIIIFDESKDLNFSFYIGISLIIGSVLLQTTDSIKKKRETELR